MSCAAAVIEQLASTRMQLDAACALLLAPTPDAVDRCATLLESAGNRLTGFRDQMAGAQGDPAAIQEARKVRRSFERTSRLLESAAHFHQNWQAVRGALTGGYTNLGEPAPLRHNGRVCLEA
jgi:hypothetical protein